MPTTARGPRPDLHDRARHRGLRRRGARARAAGGRPHARVDHRATCAASGGASPRTRSCAGSDPEKGVIHLATAAVVNAVWDLWAKLEGKPLWKLLADMAPEELVSCVDFRYIADALSPEEALDLLQRRAARRGGARARDRRLRLPGLHDVRRLARLRGRQGRVARPRGARGRLHARQDEGRRRPRLGRPPRAADPQRARPGRHPDDGRQSGLGRRRGDRGDAAARRARSVVDRGADEPRRRARPRAHPPRDRADPRRHGRARPEPRGLQAVLPGAARSTSARSTPAASAASTRRSRCCCWRRSSASRCARTPAASGSASTSSTSPSSTTSRSAVRSRTGSSSGSITCTSTSAIRRVVERGRYVAPLGPGLQHRDAALVARRVRVPGGPGVDAVEGAVGGDDRVGGEGAQRGRGGLFGSTATACCRSRCSRCAPGRP